MILKEIIHRARLVAIVFVVALGTGWHTPASATPPPGFATLPKAQQVAINDLEKRTFEFFRDSANLANGQVPDHWPRDKGDYFSSIAADGFGLTAYGIGVERGWMTRAEAVKRTLATLNFFHDAPQGNAAPRHQSVFSPLNTCCAHFGNGSTSSCVQSLLHSATAMCVPGVTSCES